MEDLDATTREIIRAARSLSDRPFEQRMTKVETLGELIEMQATRLADKPWLTYYQDGEEGSYTYGEFYREVCRTAGFL